MTPRRSRQWLIFLAIPIFNLVVAWSLNYLAVGRPVERKLSEDSRNRGYSLSSHYSYYINPSTLILDLRKIENAAPVDLFRALFQSAEALHDAGRKFEKVVLAKAGTPVFIIKGDDFYSIGAEFGAGQNPVYLIRTLPEKLYYPDGEPAFRRWEGGLIGVLGKQMEDANKAAQCWAAGN